MYRLLLSLALVSTALGQMMIGTPDQVFSCSVRRVSWSGGTPPYNLQIMAGERRSTASAIESFPGITSTFLDWSVVEPAGTQLFFRLRDSTGVTAESAPFTLEDCRPSTTSTSSPPSTTPPSSTPPSTSSTPETTETTETTESISTTNRSGTTSTPSSSSSDTTNTRSTSPPRNTTSDDGDTPPFDSNRERESSRKNTGAIAGGAAGGTTLLIISFIGGFCFFRAKKRKRKPQEEEFPLARFGTQPSSTSTPPLAPLAPLAAEYGTAGLSYYASPTPGFASVSAITSSSVSTGLDRPIWTVPISAPPQSDPTMSYYNTSSQPTTSSHHSSDPFSSTTPQRVTSPAPSEMPPPSYSLTSTTSARIQSPHPLARNTSIHIDDATSAGNAGNTIVVVNAGTSGTSNSSEQIYQDIIGQFAAANRDTISPELEAKLRAARYMPTDDPNEIPAEQWKDEYGVTYFELKRIQELYERLMK